MLHLDIWHKGHNLYCDSISFSYNSSFEKLGDFKGTIGHNTLKINSVDQMDDYSLRVGKSLIKSNIVGRMEKSYISNYYNHYSQGHRTVFETLQTRDFTIETKILFHHSQ